MPKFHTLTIKEARQETENCVSIAFDLPDELKKEYHFIPGQYVTLRADIDGEDVRRSYSICSVPAQEDLRVAIKKVPDGKFSTFANQRLRAGDTLQVMTPTGNFHTDIVAGQEKTYVFFAAGSGITPIISMVKTILATEADSQVILFYGNQKTETIIFREEIEDLKSAYMNRLRVHYVFSREHPGSELLYGRIDEEKCEKIFNLLLQPTEADEFFICGPEPMIRAVSASLEKAAIDKSRIHFELFTSPLGKLGGERIVRKMPDKKILANVHFTHDGNRYEFDLHSQGKNLLDAATEATGADLPYACKGGVCSTCKAKLTAGEVEMEVNYALEPDEVAAGYILTCQAHPLSEKVDFSFDE